MNDSNDIVKKYIEYAKEKSNIDEVLNKKLISQNENFLKLKEYSKNNRNEEFEICKKLSLELKNMDILKSYSAANFIAHAFYHTDKVDKNIGKKIIDLFYKNIDYACRFIENISQFYNVDEDEITENDIANLNLEIMYRLDYKPLEAFLGIDMMVAPIMTIACASRPLRSYFRSLEPIEYIEYLENYIAGLGYLHVATEACDITKILILSPKVERGFFIETADISNCYYLITLMEAELYKKDLLKRYGIEGYEFDEKIYNIAIGKEYPKELIETQAHQQYYTIYALRKDGKYKIENEEGELELNNIIYGDMGPEEIPNDIDDTHIIIMDSEGMWNKAVKWDTNYFTKLHPKLNPYVKILNEISDKEYKDWIKKIKAYNS